MPSRRLDDLLSPILVKEFRQGVRGYVFTGALLLLHALLLLATGFGLLLPDDASGSTTAFFWMLLVAPVGIVIPLTGMQAISSESGLKALEPMLLTRLSPRAIVFGKWASLTAQIAILVVSAAPYFLLRYFLGGLQIAHEMWGIMVLGFGAAVLTAVTVALSAMSVPAFPRWVLGLLLLGITAPFLAVSYFSSLWMGGGAYAGPIVATGLCVVTMIVMLEGGAWQIAPAADRTSAFARAAVFLWLPFATVAMSVLPQRLRPQPAFWTALLVGLVVLGSLSEPQATVSTVYARFFGRGMLRRIIGGLFAPGWPSGVLFTVVITVSTCLALRASNDDLARPEVMLAVLAQVLLPVPLLPFITFPRLPRVVWYLLIQLASFSVGVTAPVAYQVGSETFGRLLGWLLPLCPIVALAVESESPDLTSTAVDVVSLLGAAFVILLTLVDAFRGLRRAERLVRDRRADAPRTEPAGPPHEASIERVANL